MIQVKKIPTTVTVFVKQTAKMHTAYALVGAGIFSKLYYLCKGHKSDTDPSTFYKSYLENSLRGKAYLDYTVCDLGAVEEEDFQSLRQQRLLPKRPSGWYADVVEACAVDYKMVHNGKSWVHVSTTSDKLLILHSFARDKKYAKSKDLCRDELSRRCETNTLLNQIVPLLEGLNKELPTYSNYVATITRTTSISSYSGGGYTNLYILEDEDNAVLHYSGDCPLGTVGDRLSFTANNGFWRVDDDMKTYLNISRLKNITKLNPESNL